VVDCDYGSSFSLIVPCLPGYQNAMMVEFLSLDSKAGDCSSVPLTTSDRFLVDINGRFINTQAFNSAEALFELQFVACRKKVVSSCCETVL
jgi:hypothetical protein